MPAESGIIEDPIVTDEKRTLETEPVRMTMRHVALACGWLLLGAYAAFAQEGVKPPEALKLEELVDAALARLETIPDYTYHLRKQERVGEELLEPQFLITKIRHEPFSVYLRFTNPTNVKGKEAIYVEGQNDGKLIGHGVGIQKIFGTQKLDPKSALAMMGNRNPITDSGMKSILLKLKAVLVRPDALA